MILFSGAQIKNMIINELICQCYIIIESLMTIKILRCILHYYHSMELFVSGGEVTQTGMDAMMGGSWWVGVGKS